MVEALVLERRMFSAVKEIQPNYKLVGLNMILGINTSAICILPQHNRLQGIFAHKGAAQNRGLHSPTVMVGRL